MRKGIQGVFHPVNKDKCLQKEIIYKSKLELKALVVLDYNDNVKEYAYEYITIPYISPIDGRQHMYIIDIYVKYIDDTVELWEVKPKSIAYEKKTNSEDIAKEYTTNRAKWKYAFEYCKFRGWKFCIKHQ